MLIIMELSKCVLFSEVNVLDQRLETREYQDGHQLSTTGHHTLHTRHLFVLDKGGQEEETENCSSL